MNIMETRISATEAARSFSDLINRVFYRSEEFVIERGGQPVCRIVPAGTTKFTVRDMVEFLKTAPKPDPEYWDVLEDINHNQAPMPKSPWDR